MTVQKPTATFRNGIWYTLLCSVLSIILIFKLSPGFSIKMSLSQIHWGYIVLGFPVLFLVWFSKAYRMYVIAQGMEIGMNLSYFIKIYLATCFISHITPFSSGGTPLQVYLITKQGIPVGKATALTAVDLGLHSAVFGLLVPLAIFLNLKLIKAILPQMAIDFNVKWLLILLLAATGIFLLLRWRPFSDWFKKLNWLNNDAFKAKQRKWFNYVHQEWGLFREGWFVLVHQNPASIGWAILATIIYWLFYFLLAPLIIWSLGGPASFWDLIGRQLFYNFGQILIPTPGGSGGSELLLTYLFKNLTGISMIGPFVFFWKLYTFYFSLMLGGYFFFKLTSGAVADK